MGPALALALTLVQLPAPLDSVDRYVRAEVARQRIPGLSLAVLRGDSLLLARGYGEANLEHHVPAADSTVYESGSVGKQFTAALVVRLAEEGRLGLDDPIRRWLPEGPPGWDRITVRHLLTHTSGIPDYTDSVVDLRRDYTEDELVRLSAGLPPAFEPGARWSYSNTGYVLLGAIIHRATGSFYGDLLRSRVFQPLGMATARVISESDIVPNRAAGYRMVDGRVQNQEWVAPLLNTTADGSLHLTVLDLARWSVGLNHARFPSPEGLALSWTPVRLNDGGTYPYGFGWWVSEQRGRRRIGHTGSWQGFKASIQRYPEFDLTVIALANLAEAEPAAITFGVAGILEPALAAPHLLAGPLPGAMPPEPAAALLRSIAAGGGPTRVAPGLAAFLSDDLRREIGALPDGTEAASWRGCDRVQGRGIERLGARVERICYADVAGRSVRHLVEVAYAAGWRVAAVDWYDY